MSPPEYPHRLYFYGYFDQEGWETAQILCDAIGGKWDPTIKKGGAFVFPKGPPLGIPTLMCACDFPFATSYYDTSTPTPTVRWKLKRRAEILDICALPAHQTPVHRHPMWQNIFSEHSGVIGSAHHLLSLIEQGIPVDT